MAKKSNPFAKFEKSPADKKADAKGSAKAPMPFKKGGKVKK